MDSVTLSFYVWYPGIALDSTLDLVVDPDGNYLEEKLDPSGKIRKRKKNPSNTNTNDQDKKKTQFISISVN